MAISCTPADLVANSICFSQKLSDKESQGIQLYLLAVIAGLDGLSIEQLLLLSKCYSEVSADDAKNIDLMLLCEIVNA